MQVKDKLTVSIHGHLKIFDPDTGEVYLDKDNAIHLENMSFALAKSIANYETGPIKTMVFGNGGSIVNGINDVIYLTPNVTGRTADLYNPTVFKVVDDKSLENIDPDNNYITATHVDGNPFSDILVVCLLDLHEPVGQNIIDQYGTTNSSFIFNEIGLKDHSGALLTHVIFDNTPKSRNRRLKIEYNIRFESV